jgi:hypothetical protein
MSANQDQPSERTGANVTVPAGMRSWSTPPPLP